MYSCVRMFNVEVTKHVEEEMQMMLDALRSGKLRKVSNIIRISSSNFVYTTQPINLDVPPHQI